MGCHDYNVGVFTRRMRCVKVTCRYHGTCIIWLPYDTAYLQTQSRVSVMIKQRPWFNLLFYFSLSQK